MKKVLDEEEFLEYILENGFSQENNPVFHELLVVAKYFRQRDGFGQKKLVRALASFCEERNEHFNRTVERDRLKKVARVAIKNPQFFAPNYPLYFSDNELDSIRQVRPFKYQKVLFSALTFAKSFGDPSIFPQTDKDLRAILEISGEKVSVPEFISKISPLAFKHDIFEHIINRRKGGFYKLGDDGGGDVLITICNIDEFRNAGEIYRQFIGGLLEWCERCDGEFIRLGNNHIFCEDCSEIIRKEKTKNRVTKHRNI